MSLNTLRLRSPADVVSAIPYLIGFHPADSVVVLSCDKTQGTCAMRLDLGADETLLEHIADLVARRRPEAVILAGYGAATRVTPAIERLRGHLQARGVPLRDALRVEDGRFWSYLFSGANFVSWSSRVGGSVSPCAHRGPAVSRSRRRHWLAWRRSARADERPG